MEEILKNFRENSEDRKKLEEELRIAKLHKEKDEEKLEELINEFGKKPLNEYEKIITENEEGTIKEDEESVIEAYKERIGEDTNKIEELEGKINEVSNKISTIARDENIKKVTLEIKEFDKKIAMKKLELSKKEVELQEFYLKEDKEGKIVQDFYNEQDKIKKEIQELEANKELYEEMLTSMKNMRDELILAGRYNEINGKVEIEQEEKQEPVQEEKQEPVQEEKQEPVQGEKQEPAQGEKQEPTQGEKREPAQKTKTAQQMTQEQADEVTRKILIENSQELKITYNAKKDEYSFENISLNDIPKSFSRKSIEEEIDVNKEEIAEEFEMTENDLMYLDLNIYAVLKKYDEIYKTNKSGEYFKEVTKTGIPKKERKEHMKDAGIDITYNLKGAYDEMDDLEDDKQSEMKEVFEIANRTKRAGIATVKKGIKVTVMEWIDKVSDKINPKNLLPKDKKLNLPVTREKKKEEEYDKLVNKEYLETLDAKYEKGVKKQQNIQKAKKFINDKKSKAKAFAEEIRVNIDEEEAAIEAARKATVKETMKEKDTEITND